jgi:signal peptidase I
LPGLIFNKRNDLSRPCLLLPKSYETVAAPAITFIQPRLFAGLVIIWIVFAPAKIGGQASYVMVNGISMEPGYHSGDLVIVRKAPTYQVGDVVTYSDAEMGAFVIHRIIGIEQDQFVLKGDNNSWIDAYRPTQAEIAGKQWAMPKAGRTMQWLTNQSTCQLPSFYLGVVFMSSLITKPSSGQKGKTAQHLRGRNSESILLYVGISFLGFLGLSIFAFRPSRAAPRIFRTSRIVIIFTPQRGRPASMIPRWCARGSLFSPG